MTKTGITALLIVITAIFTIGMASFIFLNPSPKPALEVTPRPTVFENVASPAAIINPLPTSALPSEEATPSAQRVEVVISNSSFQPVSIAVGKGSTIVWRNQDAVAHTATAGDGSFDSGAIAAGDTFEQRFDKVKTYTYSCSIHPEMKGTIIIK